MKGNLNMSSRLMPMSFSFIKSIGAYVLVGFALLAGTDAMGCSPLAPLQVNWQVVGTQLQINITSTTAWNCCYTSRVELRCAAANFTNTYTHTVGQVCKSGDNFVVPYQQLNIDLSSYCPGTQLQFRAREGSGPITPTFNVTVPGILSPLAVSLTADPPNVCIGGCTTVSAVTTGECGNVTYNWNTGDTGPSTISCSASIVAYDVSVLVYDAGDVCSGPRNTTTIINIGVDPDPVAGTALVQPAAVCIGEDVVLSLVGSVGNVQWQSSPDGLPPWTDVGGATTVTYAFQSLTATTSFRAVVSNSCQSETSNVVTAITLPLPTVDFNFTTPCDGTAADFTDLSENTVTTWQWDFGNNVGTSAQASPSYTYGQFNTYTVTLTATDGNGCSDQNTQQVLVRPQPVADFSFVPVCDQLATVFTDATVLGTGSIASWNWDFDSQGTAAVADPSFTFNVDGTFNVTLSVVSDLGCADDVTLPVVVYPVPIAQFQWTDVCEGFVSSFTDQTTVAAPGQVVSWDWDFGDLIGTSAQPDPSYSFGQTDVYTVTLSVETADGCTHQITDQVEVFPIPVSDFTFNDVCRLAGAVFQNTSTVSSGTINVNEWDFGNGTSSVAQPPPHSYATDGIFQVSLTVETGSGCSNTSTQQIEIFPTPIAAITFDSVCFPLPVQFTDISDPNGVSPIDQWAWTFTEGPGSTEQSPLVSFNQYGAYGATLTITSAAGCKDVVTAGDALVHPLPLVNFDANWGHCLLDTVRLTDQSTVPLLSDDANVDWIYSLGDGNTIPQQNGEHSYALPGFHPVQLLVTTNKGCQDSLTQTVEVFPLPQVDIQALPSDGCAPLQVQFLDASNIPEPYSLASWQWNLGDSLAGEPALQNPYFLYAPEITDPNDSATYDISLIVTSGNGCIDSVLYENFVVVHPLPKALFSTDPGRVVNTIDPTFNITDLSTENVVDWQWFFGDGATSLEQHPEHTYQDTGSYLIEQFVETAFGCADTISYTVIVEPYFTFYIPNAFTPDEDDVNDLFFGTGEYVSEYNMKVHDRWGELLFESNDMELKWDGSYRGQQVESGQYIYSFDIVDVLKVGHRYVGSVVLLR